MNLERLLSKCRQDRWSASDLDWSRPPRAMTRDEEIALVQAFTDMAAVERIAGGLFAVQRDRVDDPVLAEIYACFVEDEARHAEVAQRLAQHFDVHRHRDYRVNPNLARFVPRLIATARAFSPEVANVYVTAGELILDVALLRALDDACEDPTCHDAMAWINRDEARHVAVDFYMLDRYAALAATRSRLKVNLRGWYHLLRMIAVARPFIRDAIVAPMDRWDPSGARLREAFKRMQLAMRRSGVAERPFPRLLRASQWLAGQPVLGAVLQPLITAVIGVDARAFERLYTPQELARVRRAARTIRSPRSAA